MFLEKQFKKTSTISGMSRLLCLLCLFIFPMEGVAMSFFGIKLCVFSAVEGQVIKEGRPIANALVKRTYDWDGESISDEVTTDQNGKFSFDNRYQRSLLALFPHNPSVSQGMEIYVADKVYLAWAYTKDNYDVNGELNGKPLKMLCDLNNSQEKHALEHHKIYSGICELR